MLQRIDLTGWWQIQFDVRDEGARLGWAQQPPADSAPINVPSCWNNVFPDYHTYDGTAWYFKQIFLRADDLNERVTLCFEGVNYRCEIFVNGERVGEHEGGFTFFAFDITRALRANAVNYFAIRVNGEHDEWTIPPKGVDWFNYNGIYRPVYLACTRATWLEDYTLKTRADGRVSIDVVIGNPTEAQTLSARIFDALGALIAEQTITLAGQTTTRVEFMLANPRLWNIGDAYLYTLELELKDAQGRACDRIEKKFGIREFAVVGQQILVNGKPVHLVGCSKHDEYPLTGRTVTREQLVTDYNLYRRMNANFVRLCHYPHSRLEHELLNELGIVSMAEIPLVFLHKQQMTSAVVLEKAKRVIDEILRAEKNETNIMFWSLFVECDTHLTTTKPFVREIIEYVRSLDNTRILIMASIRPLEDVTYDDFDVIGVNYWEGWYRNAPIEQCIEWLTALASRFPNKPILITSHGWEGLYGFRSSEERVRWSEEMQAEYLSRLADIFMRFPNIVGEIVWTFADFRVSDWVDSAHPTLYRPRYLERPMQMNHKGMVDFYRRPKRAYYVMREKFAAWQSKR